MAWPYFFELVIHNFTFIKTLSNHEQSLYYSLFSSGRRIIQ